MYGLFMDLKKAFDCVDRENFREYLVQKKMSEWLVKKIQEVYEKTINQKKNNCESK